MPEPTEALILNEAENRTLRKACQRQFDSLHEIMRAGASLPDAAYDALKAETDNVMSIWSRLSRMPEVGEK